MIDWKKKMIAIDDSKNKWYMIVIDARQVDNKQIKADLLEVFTYIVMEL